MWAHLAPLVGVAVSVVVSPLSWLIMPLSWLPVRLIRRSPSNQGDALVRNHTAQSLNSIFSGYVTLLPAVALTVLAAVPGLYPSGAGIARAVVIAAAVAVWLYAMVRGIAAIAYAIIGATRARAGLYVRFPTWVAFPLIRDDTPTQQR
jgi:hypothetical protein